MFCIGQNAAQCAGCKSVSRGEFNYTLHTSDMCEETCFDIMNTRVIRYRYDLMTF
jgi:hypothetical protein